MFLFRVYALTHLIPGSFHPKLRLAWNLRLEFAAMFEWDSPPFRETR